MRVFVRVCVLCVLCVCVCVLSKLHYPKLEVHINLGPHLSLSPLRATTAGIDGHGIPLTSITELMFWGLLTSPQANTPSNDPPTTSVFNSLHPICTSQQ